MEGINIVFIIVAAVLLLFTLDGYRKGFLRIAMEMAAYILTILLGIWLTPVVGNVIRDHTSVEQALQKRFSESVAESIDQTAEGAFGEVEEYLKSVPLPESWKKSLMEHNNDENYERLGVDTLEEYVGGYMTNIVLNVAAFLIAMLVISMVLHLLMGLLDIIGRIPVIHGINKVAGLGVGLLKGLVIVWSAVWFSLFFPERNGGPAYWVWLKRTNSLDFCTIITCWPGSCWGSHRAYLPRACLKIHFRNVRRISYGKQFSNTL